MGVIGGSQLEEVILEILLSYLIHLQAHGHTQNLTCLVHCCHQECCKVRANCRLDFHKAAKWHSPRKGMGHIKQRLWLVRSAG